MATGTQLEKSSPAIPGRIQAGGKWTGLLGMAQVRWAEMAAAERGWAIAVALLLAALIGGLPGMRRGRIGAPSTSDLDPDDARQMAQILAQAQIPFEATVDGAGIRVPSTAGQSEIGDGSQGRSQKRPDGF